MFHPLALSFALVLSALPRAQEGELPKDVRGFSGQVLGTVSARHDDGTVSLRVAQVTRVWKDNTATDLEWFVGNTLRVGPRWQKVDGGRWHPVELHVKFLAGLRERQAMRLEIRFAERDRFAILELDEEQRRAARGGESERATVRALDDPGEAERLAPELRGFCGRVAGVVRGRNDDGSIRFEVRRVERVWKNSAAEEPRSLAGETVRVTPRWVQGEDGRWRPVADHVAFLKGLEVDEALSLELQNEELAHFRILEPSPEQRQEKRQHIRLPATGVWILPDVPDRKR